MPKATIKYDLDNHDDEMAYRRANASLGMAWMAYRRANASLGMACFIHEVLLNGKRKFEHGTTIDDIWEWLWQEAKDNGIDIDKIIE
jgi:hypothetical protein